MPAAPDLHDLPLTLSVKDLRKLLPSVKDNATIYKLARRIGVRIDGKPHSKLVIPRHRYLAWLNGEISVDGAPQTPAGDTARGNDGGERKAK